MQRIDFLSSPEVLRFIRENEHCDVQQLILHPPSVIKYDVRSVADQILSRRKAKGKIPSWDEKEGLVLPPPLSIEQASSEQTAAYKSGLLGGDHLIDLTGGTGIDLLALSENFRKVSYVEQDDWLCTLFEHNFPVLTSSDIAIYQQPAEQFLRHFHEKAVFFIDPARRDLSKRRVFLFEDCSPNLIELLPLLQKKAIQVLIKVSPMIDILSGIRQLPNVTTVHVVSVNNECKEVLFLLDFEKALPEAELVCVNLTKQGVEQFTFTFSEEKAIDPPFSLPARYLYDPNTSILKAGAFKSITRRFPIKKLAVNTHLYTSEEPVEDFPGRSFEVIHTEMKKSDLKALQQANVFTKNYPLKPEALKKKYNLKDGGDYFLIGYKDLNQANRLMLASNIKKDGTK